MIDGTVRARCKALMVTLALVLAAWASPALAQTPPEGAPPAAPPAPPRRKRCRRRRRHRPHRRPPSRPRPSHRRRPKPCPRAVPRCLPPIDVGAWTRVGGIFQGSDPSKLNDWHMDNAYVELHAGGKIHKKVGVTVNLNANMLGFGKSASTPVATAETRRQRLEPPSQSRTRSSRSTSPTSFTCGPAPSGSRRPRERVGSVLHDSLELSGLLRRRLERRKRGRPVATTARSSGATSRAES